MNRGQNKKTTLLNSLGLLLLVMTLLPSGLVTAQGSTVIRINPAAQTVAVDATAETGIYVEGMTDLYGLDVRITFDPAVVQVEDADAATPGVQIGVGPVFDGHEEFVAINTVDNTIGEIQFVISLKSPAMPITGTGTVAAITWKGIAPGESVIDLAETTLASSEHQGILHTVENGTITVADLKVYGNVTLQSRSDHSGTDIYLTKDTCPDIVSIEELSQDTPGILHTTTDATGNFEVTLEPGQTYACLQAFHSGFLVAQKSVPADNVGSIKLLGGDVTEDDIINIFDLAAIASHYGTTDALTDINGDGLVNIFDLTMTAANYGQEGPQTNWE